MPRKKRIPTFSERAKMGGKRRAELLTMRQREAIARKAANVRWAKYRAEVALNNEAAA